MCFGNSSCVILIQPLGGGIDGFDFLRVILFLPGSILLQIDTPLNLTACHTCHHLLSVGSLVSITVKAIEIDYFRATKVRRIGVADR